MYVLQQYKMFKIKILKSWSDTNLNLWNKSDRKYKKQNYE